MIRLLYEQLFPFLHQRFKMRLVETHDYLPDWEARLAEVASTAGQLWIYAPSESALHLWASEQFPALADDRFDGWRLTGWRTR